jgi:hypothetical protein
MTKDLSCFAPYRALKFAIYCGSTAATKTEKRYVRTPCQVPRHPPARALPAHRVVVPAHVLPAPPRGRARQGRRCGHVCRPAPRPVLRAHARFGAATAAADASPAPLSVRHPVPPGPSEHARTSPSTPLLPPLFRLTHLSSLASPHGRVRWVSHATCCPLYSASL